jgi:hypothetical protein
MHPPGSYNPCRRCCCTPWSVVIAGIGLRPLDGLVQDGELAGLSSQCHTARLKLAPYQALWLSNVFDEADGG